MKVEKNILIAFILNLSFSIFEFIGGTLTNSVAIISDSIHDMGDSLSIGISYFLERKSRKQPDDKYTYGYIRYSVIGGAITTIILMLGSIFVIYNSVNRILHPVTIHYDGMILLAVIGFCINFIAAYATREGDSLNQRSVNLHMLEDVLGWALVLIGAIIMKFTNNAIIDPILSILVALFIFISACKNLKQILELFFEKIPNGINLDELKRHLLEIENVKDIHHVHVWSIDGFHHYATMHVVTNGNFKEIKQKIKQELLEHGIYHVTIEVENIQEKCDDCDCKVEHSNIEHHHHH